MTDWGLSDDPENVPGPWFHSRFSGDCSRCLRDFDEGALIRADGDGEYECCGPKDPSGARRERHVPEISLQPKEVVCGACHVVKPCFCD